jgi:hypothetical protein
MNPKFKNLTSTTTGNTSPKREIEALCWQFDIRLIAKLRDSIKSMAALFQNPY